jgi:hypothetical protein
VLNDIEQHVHPPRTEDASAASLAPFFSSLLTATDKPIIHPSSSNTWFCDHLMLSSFTFVFLSALSPKSAAGFTSTRASLKNTKLRASASCHCTTRSLSVARSSVLHGTST